ncbi:MAG TPA: M48 family metallopeptidase [Pyrinomonadaceae bacterium]|jgi:Zn-dependent protease with chaperone function|nr:M48 family metallopeptidase [Pyrinomonadaceae bacterium]
MRNVNTRFAARWAAWLLALALIATPLATFGQTQIKYHSNKYSPSDDVKVGRQAAAEAEQQFPLLRDSEVQSYVESVGQRLVTAIPPEFQHPEFRYYFRVINASDINAFALPGGPMYVNRGMIQAARSEGEMAGVMAHELSHVALRHGTAQATKAQKYGLLAGIAGIAGTIFGGPGLGQVAQGSVGVYFLKFSREYETEADLLGARIMANAGYDPRELANMFQTIQRQGGGGGGFFSDHPSPANRYERINQEAQSLQVRNVPRDNRQFIAVNERLRGYPRAQTMAEIQRSGRRYPNQGDPYPNGDRTGDRTGYGNPPSGRVDSPSSRFRNYSVLNVAQVSVPENWREVSDSGNSIWFAPSGAYGSTNGQSVFTHGVNFGVFQPNSRSLQQATNEFINSLQQGNGNLRSRGGYMQTTIDGRNALSIALNNVNEATGRQEIVTVITTQLRNGGVLYMIAVAPNDDFANYQNVFQNILRSVQVNG